MTSVGCVMIAAIRLTIALAETVLTQFLVPFAKEIEWLVESVRIAVAAWAAMERP